MRVANGQRLLPPSAQVQAVVPGNKLKLSAILGRLVRSAAHPRFLLRIWTHECEPLAFHLVHGAVGALGIVNATGDTPHILRKP